MREIAGVQIDMHDYGVYAMARPAGLRPAVAGNIATASQYVDDAVDGDIKYHEQGNKLAPIITAHRIIEIVENRDLDIKLDGFFRRFGFQGGLWTNVRGSIMSDGAEIASGALGHGAVDRLQHGKAGRLHIPWI